MDVWSEEEREALRRGGLDPDAPNDPRADEAMLRQIIADEAALAEIIAEGIPGLADVLAALPGDCHPAEVYGWLTTPNPDLLGMSALDWLRAGRSRRVLIQHARAEEYGI